MPDMDRRILTESIRDALNDKMTRAIQDSPQTK